MFRDKESGEIYPNLKQSQVFIKKNNSEETKLYSREIKKITKEFINDHLDDETYVFYDTRKLFDEYCKLFYNGKNDRESLAKKLDGKEAMEVLGDIAKKDFEEKNADEKLIYKQPSIIYKNAVIERLDSLATKTSLRELIQKYYNKEKKENDKKDKSEDKNYQQTTTNGLPIASYQNAYILQNKNIAPKEIDIPSFMSSDRRKIIDYEDFYGQGEKNSDTRKKKVSYRKSTNKKRKISGFNKRKIKIRVIIGLVATSLGIGITAKIINNNYNKNYVTSYENAVNKGLDYNDFLSHTENKTKIYNLEKSEFINTVYDNNLINIIENSGTTGLYENIKDQIDLYQKEIPKVDVLKNMQKEARVLSELVLQDEICDGYNEWKNDELKKETEGDKFKFEVRNEGNIDYQEQAQIVEFDSSRENNKYYIIKNADGEEIANIKKLVGKTGIEEYKKKQKEALRELNKKMNEIESYKGDYYSSNKDIKEYVNLLEQYVDNSLDFSTKTVQIKKGFFGGTIVKTKDTPAKEITDYGR